MGITRRDFAGRLMKAGGGALMLLASGKSLAEVSHGAPEGAAPGSEYNPESHRYVFLVDTFKCIGCGMCVRACSRENTPPEGFYRTWVERYLVSESGQTVIDSPRGALHGFEPETTYLGVTKAFFVPKLCNHCEATPCTQVCPVGASYSTKEGIVLVDPKHCIGCGYCVQACPYGSRFINPVTRTADKCTWCYHRLYKGMQTACIQACPTGARQMGDIKQRMDPVRKILATERVGILQPQLLTKPRCYYLGIDMEVR